MVLCCWPDGAELHQVSIRCSDSVSADQPQSFWALRRKRAMNVVKTLVGTWNIQSRCSLCWKCFGGSAWSTIVLTDHLFSFPPSLVIPELSEETTGRKSSAVGTIAVSGFASVGQKITGRSHLNKKTRHARMKEVLVCKYPTPAEMFQPFAKELSLVSPDSLRVWRMKTLL